MDVLVLLAAQAHHSYCAQKAGKLDCLANIPNTQFVLDHVMLLIIIFTADMCLFGDTLTTNQLKKRLPSKVFGDQE